MMAGVDDRTEHHAGAADGERARLLGRPRPMTKTADIAVVIHLDDVELWERLLLPKLKTLSTRVAYDLFVSLAETSAGFVPIIRGDYPDVNIDFASDQTLGVQRFGVLGASLANYQYVLNLGPKGSTDSSNASCRIGRIVESLVPEDDSVFREILAVLGKEDTGVLGCGAFYHSLVVSSDGTGIAAVDSILANQDIDHEAYQQLRDRGSLGYFAEAMFWARVDAIKPLFGDCTEVSGREADQAGVALERALTVLPEVLGKAIFICNGLSVSRINNKSAVDPTRRKGVDDEENPLITVIVPCYNVEEYIATCVDSLLGQTYPDIKILLIDDKSTDGTAAKIAMYARDFPHTVSALFNPVNKGTGYTRNLGLANAKSEELGFIDPDDWVPPNYFEEMHCAMVGGDFNLAVCEMVMCHSRANPTVPEQFEAPSIHDIVTSPMAASSTNKLFKAFLFDGMPYPEGIMNEDVSVIIPLLFAAKIVHAGRTHYNYFQRGGSTQNSYTLKRLDMFTAMSLARERSGPVSKERWQATEYHQIIEFLLYVVPRFTGFAHRRDFLRRFRDRARTYGIDLNGNVYLRGAMSANGILFVYAKSLLWSLGLGRFGIAAMVSRLGNEMLNIQQTTRYKTVRHAISRLAHPKSVLRGIARIGVSAMRNPRAFLGRATTRPADEGVIRPDISMSDLVSAADTQKNMPGQGNLSVIVPNFNYERFMLQRIFSILDQTVKVGEIIVLDDASDDGSVAVIQDIIDRIGSCVDIRVVVNSVNCGPFRQWERGFLDARYGYVWIAEADDYSDSAFLATVLPPFANGSVVLSYCDTAFIDGAGRVVRDSIKSEIDTMNTGHWNGSYVNSGIGEDTHYMAVNCTIANVSSVVFRKVPEADYGAMFAQSRDFAQVGDWVFYFNYLLLGDISYVDTALNYYRAHGDNVSSNTKAKAHFVEMQVAHAMFVDRLGLKAGVQRKIVDREDFVARAWGLR